jgi:hypothetical protein
MIITVETCGKAYCEHYPEGLPVCAKCREESTLAHDKACALLAEARADADHWKSECNALQRMVHEARAEIERLRKQHLDRASATLWAIMRHAFMDGAFKGYQHGTEERLRVQYFNEWRQKNYPEAVGEAIAQMGLIEQMREALKAIDGIGREAGNARREDALRCFAIAAAALAAERGEEEP